MSALAPAKSLHCSLAAGLERAALSTLPWLPLYLYPPSAVLPQGNRVTPVQHRNADPKQARGDLFVWVRQRQHLQQFYSVGGAGGGGAGGGGGRRRAAITEHREMEAGDPGRASKASERPSSRQVRASGLRFPQEQSSSDGFGSGAKRQRRLMHHYWNVRPRRRRNDGKCRILKGAG